MLDNHNVRICRVDMFRVVIVLCPTKVIKIVELCKKILWELPKKMLHVT